MKTEAQFQVDAVADFKAVEVSDDGSLTIEFLASDWEDDRQHEAFEPGAFKAAIDKFLGGNPVFLYHHQNDFALGQVSALEERPDGLYGKAILPRPTGGDRLAVWQQIKDGVIRGVSVAGQFYRRMTTQGPRIHRADLHEISATPVPVNPRTLLTVAAKAFTDEDFDWNDPALVAALDRAVPLCHDGR